MTTLTEWLMKSKLRIVLIGLLIPTIPLLALAGFQYVSLSHDIGELLVGQTEAITTNAVERIETALARDIAVALVFATRPHLLLMLQQGDTVSVTAHLKNLVDHLEHVERATIVDMAGIQITNYPFVPETVGMDFSQRDDFLGVTRHWSAYVSDFFLRAAEPRRHVFSVAVPLIKDGSPLGVLSIQPKADYFHRLLEGVLAPEGHISVVDSEGILVFSSLTGELTEPRDLSRTPVVQRILQGLSGVTQAIDEETGELVFTSYRLVPDYGWGVFVEIPARVVYAPLAMMMRWTLAVTLLLLCAGGLFGYRWSLLLESQRKSAARLSQQAKELAALNKQVTAASAAKSAFLANVSHELRTPLNSIIGFSQILEDGLAGNLNEQQAEYVGYVLSSSTHLLSLINDILDLSKVEAGKLELETTRFSLRHAMEAVVAQTLASCNQKSIELKVEIDALADVELEADERKFKQILLNLLSNAIKFTLQGGSVEICGRLIPAEGEGSAVDYIEVAVSDNGIGIKQEDFSKLFQPFSQIESSHTRTYEGTGLGLALTKKFVELHNGTIRVESEFGRGSRFTIVLPIRHLG